MTRQTFGARLYRRLLRLYPREFRDDYGAEMARLYTDRASDEAPLRLWPAIVADVARTAPKEHFHMLMQDVRHAFRLFARTPIVTATALLTVAVGLGGSTAVFSVVHGVLLRPLPYPNPDRLVELFEDNRPANAPGFRVSRLNYLSWVERSKTMEALAAFQNIDLILTDSGEPERVVGTSVTASMFDVLGVAPIMGRTLSAVDERPGAQPVVLLGESLWLRRFGGDPSVVGRLITLNGERCEVIGVLPRAFRDVGRSQATSVAPPQLFVPYAIDPARENRGNHVLRVVGRLRADVTLEQARGEMHRIAAALETEFPATNKGWGARVARLHDTMIEPRVRASLLVLFAAMGVVLLIACANVANLLLARSIARQRELALRTALGAGRSRLVRQLVTEGMCLAVISGACGLLLCVLAVRTLRAMLPATLPRIDEVGADATVLGGGLILSLACGVLIGLLPAIRASRPSLLPALAQSGKGIGGSSRKGLRHGIVVAQMALATMLLVGAALLIQSFVRLQHVRLGFEPEGVISARLSLPRAQYPDAERTAGFHRRLLESLGGLPQVQAAAIGSSAPFSPGVRASGGARDRAAAPASPDAAIGAVEHYVSEGYFRTLAIPLLAGRSFGPQDGRGSPPVAVISDGLARQLWPRRNPIGQALEWKGGQFEVIGTVGDIRGADGIGTRGGSLDRAPAPAVYFSTAQSPLTTVTVIVRASGDPAALASALARAVHDIDAALPVQQTRRLRDWLDESAAEPRFTTMLCGVFAAVALLLAVVGVYGVLSYSVAQRTQEIGVRLAIGAARGQILRLILRGGMAWAAAGIALGTLGALALSRVLGTLLFEVSARDPLTYFVVAAMLALVALLACAIPAARATRIDPLIALRSE